MSYYFPITTRDPIELLLCYELFIDYVINEVKTKKTIFNLNYIIFCINKFEKDIKFVLDRRSDIDTHKNEVEGIGKSQIDKADIKYDIVFNNKIISKPHIKKFKYEIIKQLENYKKNLSLNYILNNRILDNI